MRRFKRQAAGGLVSDDAITPPPEKSLPPAYLENPVTATRISSLAPQTPFRMTPEEERRDDASVNTTYAYPPALTVTEYQRQSGSGPTTQGPPSFGSQNQADDSRPKGERSFSAGMESFFAKARRSSYNYKVGP